MKKFIYVIALLVLLTIPTVVVFALEGDPGSRSNPFYFKEVEKPFEGLSTDPFKAIKEQMKEAERQRQINESKVRDLSSQYGGSAYNDCYRQSGAAGKDMSDPSVQSSYLSWTKYCLEKKVTQGQNTQQQDTCANGYEWNSDRTGCVKTVICPSNSYIYSFWYGRACRCIDGLFMLSGQCVTYTAMCQQLFGAHSVGQKDESPQYPQPVISGAGGGWCGCEVGYQMNSGVCVKSETITIIPSQPSNDVKLKTNPPQNKPANKPVGNSKITVPTKPSVKPKELPQKPATVKLEEKEGAVVGNVTGPAMSLLPKPKIEPSETRGLFGSIRNFFSKLFK